MENKLYVIERRGIYGQGIGGVFADENTAIDAAKELCAMEPDNYHNFAIIEFVLGKTNRDVQSGKDEVLVATVSHRGSNVEY